MAGHHLVMGELQDFLTGETIADTDDERYRQLIARMLIEAKGYSVEDVRRGEEILIQAGNKRARWKVDFSVTIQGKTRMIIQYGPGSVVTRIRPALALSRLLRLYQIPVVVVTNGIEAEILDGASASVTASGIEAIPHKHELMNHTINLDITPILSERADKEARIVFAYNIDDSCPCDDTICRLD